MIEHQIAKGKLQAWKTRTGRYEFVHAQTNQENSISNVMSRFEVLFLVLDGKEVEILIREPAAADGCIEVIDIEP